MPAHVAHRRGEEPNYGGTDKTGRNGRHQWAWDSVGSYTVLFVLKVITYFVTGVGVMYAEALHSLADMLISGFLLVAALWSRKPADQRYRFGYRRA